MFWDEGSGALTKKSSQARLVPTKTKTEEAEAKPRTSQAKTSTRENTRAQAEPRTRQGKVSQDKLKQSSNFKKKLPPV